MIDKKSKPFFIIILSLIMISIVVTFNKYIINKNFEIFTDEQVFNETMFVE